jgi:hypothetical protein
VNQITSTYEEAKTELAAVLSSAAFVRSPRMASLLTYLCSKYFAHESDGLKEYSIAVEVLGRPASFDPATDASARVEVHRLRRKLREYYEGEGASDTVQITIPSGSYTPVFNHVEPLPPTAQAIVPVPLRVKATDALQATPSTPTILTVPRLADLGKRRNQLLLALTAILVGLAGLFFGYYRLKSGRASDRPLPVVAAIAPSTVSVGNAVRILCGQTKPHTDREGGVWGPDRFFLGGGTFERTPQFMARTHDDALFQFGRMGNFGYDIPLKPGVYELHLYFAETTFGQGTIAGGGETSRLFHVEANGVQILTDFDILADASGPWVADVRVFKDISPARDGNLHLRFISIREQATVSAIELVPAHPHRINSIRIAVGDNSYTDSAGQMWMPDNYWSGGQKVGHMTVVQAAHDPDLYRTERFGNFSYNIPVAPGLYDVAIHLAETYWRPQGPAGGGVGSRVFDIFCNGVALIRGLDIFKEVGANRELVERFQKLRPNAQGKLCLSFVPLHNYASVYAIEVHNVGD